MGVQRPYADPLAHPPRGGFFSRFPRLAAFRDDAAAWCAGRSCVWRAVLLAYLAWVGVRHLRDPFYSSLFGGITLGIHELGHLLLSWAGQFPGVAGGSLAQVAAPAAAAWRLYRQRDYFGVAVAGAWEAFSLWNLATYVGDARAMELPLVGFVSDPIHDWNWLLSKLGILTWDRGLATLARFSALTVWAAALALGVWLCRTMAGARKRERGARMDQP
ncbi:MAG: hypothetical protein ABR576_11065 [Thermoanaerobaculia bacterium]